MRQSALSSLLVSALILLSILSYSKCQEKYCASADAGLDQIRAGYWFSQYSSSFPVSSIKTSFYTHLYYYSLYLGDTTSSIIVALPSQFQTLGNFSRNVKSNNPSLKTILSIATNDQQTNASNVAFSNMVADPTLRASFIKSTLELARANEFDGLDLAWQFPSSPIDMANLGILLAEWRTCIREEGLNSSSNLLLTATVYFSNHLFDESTDNLDYPIDAMSRNLDWVNALCFGYHKSSNITAHSAALIDKTSHFSTSYGITSWLDAGIPACKLVMGIPLYGSSWFLRNKDKNEPGAPAVATGPKQRMSNQTGLMAFTEIIELLEDSNSCVFYDNQTVTSYFSSGDWWVSFDSPEVVEEKIRFVRHNSLLGYFLWPISFDDLNYTISKQASEAWLSLYDSSYSKDEYGSEKAPSPHEVPPQYYVPTPSLSGSTLRSLNIHNFYLDMSIFFCFLFHLTLLQIEM